MVSSLSLIISWLIGINGSSFCWYININNERGKKIKKLELIRANFGSFAELGSYYISLKMKSWQKKIRQLFYLNSCHGWINGKWLH